MYRTAVESSASSRMYRLIDRSQIDSMPELVDSLLDTITKLSNYRKPNTTPRVTKVSRSEIERTLCGRPCPVKAWHVPGEGIFIDDSLAPETDLIHRSILLHELVHFLQDINAEGAALGECDRWLHREREAYTLQNQYLALVGNSRSYNTMLANQSWISSSHSTCDGWRRGVNAAQ
ncbi:MAG TPA: hypothetical protein VMH26_03695 [Burkholderiales bacterium]|nr:hypothetical protein [Burkholderiales bacterium]